MAGTLQLHATRDVFWTRTLERQLAVFDALAIVIAIVIAHLIRFGADTDVPVSLRASVELNYTVLGTVIGCLWWLALHLWASRDVKVLGTGVEEYKRVIVASLAVFGTIALVSYAFQAETARGYVGIALPLGLILLVIERALYRKHIRTQRAQGRFTRRMLLIGRPVAVLHLAKSLRDTPGAGYVPVGAIVSHSASGSRAQDLDLPVVSYDQSVTAIIDAVDSEQIDAVAISAGAELDPSVIRELGWQLQAREVSMIVAPALTDVAGPRIHTQPIAGLPLIHVATPKLEGLQAVSKRAFDLAASVLGLCLLSPVLLVTALVIWAQDGGPAFFHQERIGKDGRPFRMHKFRSMVVDAEVRLEELSSLNEGSGVLFKLKQDPRVTRVGAFIRRYSIDELPQLWNVLVGDMSLVGPRPPLPREVEAYEGFVSRRLMVKPGITGLWQVSGRSNLSWDDSVRLDLYYVENWSLTQDLLILAKTAKAVIGKDGAY